MGQCVNQEYGFQPTKALGITVPCAYLAEYGFLPIRYLVSHDIVANPGQLVGNGFGSHDLIGLSRFSLIVPAEVAIGSSGKIRGLNEGPAQVAVAILSVSLALFFPSVSLLVGEHRA